MGPKLAPAALLLLLAAAPAGTSAQETGPSPAPAPAPPPAPAPAPPEPEDAMRPLGPDLFPLYQHYLRTRDNTEVRNVLFLYQTTHQLGRGERGDKSRLLVPLYYWQRKFDPPDRRLYLFPFLFFHRSSLEDSFNYAIPFFYDHRTPRRSVQVAAPFWWRTQDRERRITTQRFFPPFFRVVKEEEQTPPRPERDLPRRSTRLGVPYLLELFESRVSQRLRRFAALNIFNWRGEAEGGVALFRKEWTRTPEGAEEERTFLFPVFWRSKEAQGRELLLVGPFHGSMAGGEVARKFYTPLVWRAEGEGGFRSLLVFPLYHRATREQPPRSYFASYPFYDSLTTRHSRRFGVLGIAYRSNKVLETGKTIRHVLFPLGYFDVEPDLRRGHRRLLPFFLDDFNTRRRFRFSFPLWWNYQSRSGEETLFDFTLVLPTYFGWGAPRDYFAFGFPLYWSSRTGSRGWGLFIPLFYRQEDATSRSFYSLPFSWIRYPSQRAASFLAGAATARRFYGLQGEGQGWSVDLLWWLWGVERRPQSGQVRLLPLFWTAREGEDRRLLLFPLWYGQWGPAQRQSYFFPIYGRSLSSDGLRRRDFYGAGIYVKTRQREPGGRVFRTRDDVLWSLLSFQKNLRTRESHSRVLPFWWQSRGVNADRTVAIPFYYSHRLVAEDRTHHLKLVLGNFYLEKSSVEHRPPAAGPSPAAGAPAAEGSFPREKGVLWPLSRWGRDARGDPYEWALPFYYHHRKPTEEIRSFFPLAYTQEEKGTYRPRYFRYFFLFNREIYDGGHRFTLGQILFDWKSEYAEGRRRLRLLYPLLDGEIGPEGWRYAVTPIWQGGRLEEGGERRTQHYFFPFYFQGKTELKRADGGYTTDARHFYLFPFYGVNRKSLRTERDILIPLIHTRRTLEGFAFHLRPVLGIRSEPGETTVRLWPLHASERGESSGEWWVSRYLFLSKLAVRRQSVRYRLDPFLAHVQVGRPLEETFDRDPLTLFSYRSSPGETGTETAWRLIPLAYGYSRSQEAGAGFFPLIYARDFGQRPIDRAVPWRFFFFVNHLRGEGLRHTSLLWKLAEYTSYAGRPGLHDFRILEGFLVKRRGETDRQFTLNPLFSYYRDVEKGILDWSVVFSLYRYRKSEGIGVHRLFWFIRWLD